MANCSVLGARYLVLLLQFVCSFSGGRTTFKMLSFSPQKGLLINDQRPKRLPFISAFFRGDAKVLFSFSSFSSDSTPFLFLKLIDLIEDCNGM